MTKTGENGIAKKKLWTNENGIWLPKSVSWYEGRIRHLIRKTPTVSNAYKIRKNISYALQYLEYLDQTREQLKLTSVIITHTYKSYIITATSVIEAIFYYLAKKHEKNLKPEWVAIDTQHTHERTIHGELPKRTKIISEQKTHVDLKTDIKFNQLSRKVEANKLLGDTTIYPKVKTLRDLRNRIHMFSSGDETQMDTDYNAINRSDYLLAKEITAEVLMRTGMFTKDDLNEIGIIDNGDDIVIPF